MPGPCRMLQPASLCAGRALLEAPQSCQLSSGLQVCCEPGTTQECYSVFSGGPDTPGLPWGWAEGGPSLKTSPAQYTVVKKTDMSLPSPGKWGWERSGRNWQHRD